MSLMEIVIGMVVFFLLAPALVVVSVYLALWVLGRLIP